ncbi:Cytosolic copper metallochaperone [Mortierella sp. AM989]|nr:Cytosolic copper metallochaperone [Mortierella sp. AM989]
MTEYKYDVTMSCGGCSGAVIKTLAKVDGIEKFDVSLADQKVTVESSTLSEAEILAVIQGSGKIAKVASQ